MNTQLIWHIMKKDFRHTWMWMVAYVVSLACFDVPREIYYFVPHTQDEQLFWIKASQMTIPLVMISIVLFLSTLFHAEAIPGERQYWLARPIHWRDLLIAKAGLAFTAILLPLTLTMVAVLEYQRLSASQHLPALLLSAAVFAFFLIPLFALLAVTKNLQQLSISAVVILAGVAGLSFMSSGTGASTSKALWLGQLTGTILLVLVPGGILIWQYATRRTQVARISLVLTLVLLMKMDSLLPSGMLVAAQQLLAPVQMDSGKARIELDEVREWPPNTSNTDTRSAWDFFLPVRVLGLSSTELAAADVWDRVEVYAGGERMPPLAPMNPALHRIHDQYWLRIPLSRTFLERHMKDAMDFKLSALVELYGNRVSQFKTITADDTEVAGVGKCRIQDFAVMCYAPFQIRSRVQLFLGFPGRAINDYGVLLNAGSSPASTLSPSPFPIETVQHWIPKTADRKIEFETSERLAVVDRTFEAHGIHLADYVRFPKTAKAQ